MSFDTPIMSRRGLNRAAFSSTRGVRLRSLRHLGVGFMTLTLLLSTPACRDDTPRPPVLPGVAEPPCQLKQEAFAISQLNLPGSSTELRDTAFDLDLDGRPDYGIASFRLALSSQLSAPVASDWRNHIDAALADGRATWILVAEVCADGSSDHARVGLYRATDADGDGVFEMVRNGQVPAVGQRDAIGHILATEGTGTAPIVTLFDPLGRAQDAGWVSGSALSVELGPVISDGTRVVRLGLALEHGALDRVVPPLAGFLTEDASSAPGLARLLDSNTDGAVSEEEFRTNVVMKAMLADDVDVLADYEGKTVYWPSRDDQNDSSSLSLVGLARRVEIE